VRLEAGRVVEQGPPGSIDEKEFDRMPRFDR